MSLKRQHAIFITSVILLGAEGITSTPMAQFSDSLAVAAGEQSYLVFGAATSDKTGWSATSGDFNGDGVLDVAVASTGASPFGRTGVGETVIFWGGAAHADTVDLASTSAGVSRIIGEGPYLGLYQSLSAGDIDGDGCDDIIIGLTQKLPFTNADGVVYVVFGSQNFPALVDLLTTSHRVTRIVPLTGNNGWFGTSVAAGDVNADGFDEVLVAEPFTDIGGKVYAVQGSATWPGVLSVADDPTWFVTITPETPSEALGQGIAIADVNGDGIDDLILGSPGYAQTGGKATLILGRSPMSASLDLSASLSGVTEIFPEPNSGTLVTTSLGSRGRIAAGDVNGDGYDDIVLSDPDASPLGCNACGVVYILFGGSELPDNVHLDAPELVVSKLTGAGDFANYGATVAVIDFLDDGFAEVVVLNEYRDYAPDSDQGRNEIIIAPGRAVFPESMALPTDETVFRIIGQPKWTNFGHAISASDWNGDGRRDLTIGAYRAPAPGKTYAGRVYGFNSTAIPTSVPHFPQAWSLSQNYPNPFNPRTTLKLFVNERMITRVDIIDIRGKVVRNLVKGSVGPGEYELVWDGMSGDGTRLPSGVYFCRTSTPAGTSTRKLVLLR